MSLILEALRKSEAERQRGRSPGLFVEQRPARARERRVPAWAIALGALLVAVLLAWGWREWRRPAVIVVTEAQPTQPAPRTEPAPPAPGPLAPITLAPAAPAPVVAPAPEVVAPSPPPPTAAA
ncbi:MAG: hypothetical protein NT046_02660, partial [Arenimonas sp.]|nr:hypothetical protein [Arenimonas sp.]